MHALPDGAPATLFEAFAHIAACETPSLDDLKIMVLLEAAGKRLYDDLAADVAEPDVKALLERNGREELAHAHRVSRAIGKLSGEDYPVPGPTENPYIAVPLPRAAVTREKLLSLAEGEDGGNDLYARWAATCASEEAAELFRHNGREELEHGSRLRRAAELLAV